MANIIIHGLDRELRDKRGGLDLGKSAAEAFPFLTDQKPTTNSYASAMYALESALHWCWLEWHNSRDARPIIESIRFVVHRVADVNRLAANQGLRGLHDIFLLQTAVLSGSESLMVEAANLVGQYDQTAKLHPYEWGLVGVYKNAILNQQDLIQTSFALLSTSRASPPYRMPAKGVLQAFVKGDQQALRQGLKRLWKKEWERLAEEKGILEQTQDWIRVSLRHRETTNLWPWPEAALAKLGRRRGFELPSDPLWCSEGLLNSSSM